MDMLIVFLKMAGSLLVVLGGIALTAYLAKRFVYPRLGLKSSPIQVLATSHLGQRKQISLIEVGGVYLLVGVTASQITLLTQMDKFPFNGEVA
jgi:flagellar protein FliO/FliZ